jgi:hypothetical protein
MADNVVRLGRLDIEATVQNAIVHERPRSPKIDLDSGKIVALFPDDSNTLYYGEQSYKAVLLTAKM